MNTDNEKLLFWQNQLATPQGMMLNEQAMKIDQLEQQEIINYLPILKDKQVLELAAGIGRYTNFFATVARSVVVVDFVEKFLQQNKLSNANANNIIYHCGNVMDIRFPSQSFDFIFINWLCMYLEDQEVNLLIDRLYGYLKPASKLFLRESCVQASNPNVSHPHSHYRDPQFYEDLLLKKFKLLSKGHIHIYETLFNNPNQIFWLVQKF